MQSHASRHTVPEFLSQLHPDLSEPFPKGVIADEISIAYGRRGVIKLIDVLGLVGLSDEDRAHALRVLNGLLSTQEIKVDAIAQGACTPLTALVNESGSDDVRRLSCEALASIAMIVPGRIAVHEAKGIDALTVALTSTPEAAAGALRNIACSIDGAKLLHQYLDKLVPALVKLVMYPGEGHVSIKACENTAATLAGLTTMDIGIMAALRSHVPKCLVELCSQGIFGVFKYEASLMALLEACTCCLSQISHHPYGKTAIREAEALAVFSELLVLHHRPTVSFVLSTLMGASIEKEFKLQIVQKSGMPIVTILKRSDDEQLKNKARQILLNCVEHLEARALLLSMMTFDEQQEMLFHGPLPPAPPDFRQGVKATLSLDK